jgi:hypothetical protein
MRAQTYRPRIQNGTVSKRNKSTIDSKASGRRGTSRHSSQPARRAGRRQKNRREEGSNLFLTLVIVGALVATGFVFALRSQINARELGQAEQRLRSELDEIADQQRYDVLEQQRTMSLRESERAAQQAGLIQPRLNQPKDAPKAPNARPSQPGLPASSRSSKARKENNNNLRQSDRLAQRR